MARQLAVIGSPISHSLSPRIHRAAYRALSLDWTYEAINVDEAEFSNFIQSLDANWLGLSVTMPLKSNAFLVAESYGEDAALTSLANTLVRSPSGLWHAENTDVTGLAAALTSNVAIQPQIVCIIGTGATAKSALIAVSRAFQGSEMVLVGRNREARNSLIDWAESIGIRLRGQDLSDNSWCGADMVISTVPSSAHGELAHHIDSAYQPLRTFFDVAYDPWPSAMAQTWLDGGGKAIRGTEMLLQQAMLQIDSFLRSAEENPVADREAVLTAMRSAL